MQYHSRKPEDLYHQDTQEVFTLLGSSTRGISPQAANERLAQDGPNLLTEKKNIGPIKRFLLQFHDLLIYVLLAAAVITALMHEWVDSGVIFGVVIINAIIGFIQEAKAENAIDSLKKMLSLDATVIRDGKEAVIPAEMLVAGDVVVLGSGDKIPADVRLFKVRNLHIDEAALTGESLPVSKTTEPSPRDTEIADRRSMAYSGTFVTSGQGLGVVTATGDRTEIGRIAGMLQDVEEVITPLTRKLAEFSKTITFVIIAGCLVVYAFGTMVKGQPAIDMFMAAVALAISAIPEGLPAIMTITLAIGVTRMARRNAIIRKLPAVETLGSTTVICSDKTGTLTRNEMTVTRVVTPEGGFNVTGVGYAPTGSFTLDEQTVSNSSQPSLIELLRAATLCNDATLIHKEADWSIVGDPTEGALIVAARKLLRDLEQVKNAMPRTDSIPFESEQQYMATLHHDHMGGGFIFIKGAPEKIISLCGTEYGGADMEAGLWEEHATSMASDGLRVLGFAFRGAPHDQMALDFEDITGDGFTFLGLMGMRDPLRQEVVDSVAACRSAGIRVKMITGDHALTARAIADALGLGSDVITGAELDRLDGEAFDEAAASSHVFARVNPSHKLRLVQSLQKRSEVVAMTGDGVNDAPALKQADIGIAMGITGTEVSKEASDMVIADDNFASIERAVEEGRTVFNNIKKTIMFILPTNGGECIVIIWAIITGSMMPVLPLHILWINMITTVALAITLAFEPVEPDIMRAKPRGPNAPLMEPYLIWRIVLVSIVMAVGCFGLFTYEIAQGASVEAARSVAVNTIVFFEVFYVLNARYLTESVLNIKGLFGSRVILLGIAFVVLSQLLFSYWPLLYRLFKVEPISLLSWARLLAVSASILFIVEAEKAFVRRKQHSTKEH